MKPGYLIFLIVFLAANAIRFAYEMLKRVGKVNSQNRPLFIFILLVMICLWVSWFTMCVQDPVYLKLPDVIVWLGFGVFAVGLLLAFGALFQLRGVENIDHLVTTGLFKKLRHPMYVGFISWIVGWAIFNGAGVSLAAGLVGIANIIYWRRLEDGHLAKTYGDEYLTYRSTTWW